jgi:hypothetical protein
MYGGYSMMEVDSTCDWNAHRDDAGGPCDYGVRIEYTQVLLPPAISAEPIACGSFDFGWVRQTSLTRHLRHLSPSDR